MLLFAWPTLAADSTVAARSVGCQIAGIGLLHLLLHLPRLFCATRQPFSLLPALAKKMRIKKQNAAELLSKSEIQLIFEMKTWKETNASNISGNSQENAASH